MPFFFTLHERRASTVLYRYLCGVIQTGSWLLPANVCPIVPAVFAKAGKEFEFLDISPDTLCLDESLALERIRKKPGKIAGVLFVHTYGYADNFDAFFARIKSFDHRIQIIDDKCLCRPCFNPTGKFADLELYSSGYSKYVELGWGGWGYLRTPVPSSVEMEQFQTDAHNKLLQLFRTTLKEKKSFVCPRSPWLDTRMPEVAFSELIALLEERLPAVDQHRARLNAIYQEKLMHWALSPQFLDWRFTIRCTRQTQLLDAIFAAGHIASNHYPSLVPMFGCGNAPIAEALGKQCINLFNDYRYTEERAKQLTEIVYDLMLA